MTVHVHDGQTDGPFAGYADPEQQPVFGNQAAFAALFNAGLVAGVLAARRRGHPLPEYIDERDLLLTGVATQKLSRLIAKEKLMAFARAPFTELEGKGGAAQLEERARGHGLQRTIGELLTCPYCLGMWISGGFHLGLVAAPRSTRFFASILASVGIADFLQVAYKIAQKKCAGDL